MLKRSPTSQSLVCPGDPDSTQILIQCLMTGRWGGKRESEVCQDFTKGRWSWWEVAGGGVEDSHVCGRAEVRGVSWHLGRAVADQCGVSDRRTKED